MATETFYAQTSQPPQSIEFPQPKHEVQQSAAETPLAQAERCCITATECR
jgi:hypothetical protein